MITRFAPSTTGDAHPGTLLSALLVWLEARRRAGRALLRLEDLDVTRVKAGWAVQLIDACAELGLTWDGTVLQSAQHAAHEAALDQLEAAGRLYPCACSRADRTGGRRAPDGGWAYENTCRGQPMPGGWRAQSAPIRLQLDDDRVELVDDGGLDLSQTPAHDLGDPIVRRRDGVVAYHLAVVVDDASAQITDVIRGKDIAPSTATQVLIQRALHLPTPRYRHHFLLLEADRTGKLSKLHGSLPYSELRTRLAPEAILGQLAHVANLVGSPAPLRASEIVLDWARVPTEDRTLEL
ncbi:tRNA glutamyl-Q(34) synthetase GluQRS [soil metagenome]